MQEGYEDYSDIEYGYNSGCCLHCSGSKPGCLCFNCKCSKCYWYSEGEDKGYCDKVSKERLRKHYANIETEKWKKLQRLIEQNEELDAQMKITNKYSCQRCQKVFSTEKEYKIVLGQEPLCPICKGEIK